MTLHSKNFPVLFFEGISFLGESVHYKTDQMSNVDYVESTS